MESEKVKEIKKALEYNVLSEFMNRLPYADEFNKLKMVSFEDILTLINELESENERLENKNYQLEQDLGQCQNGYKLELHTERLIHKQLKDRIAELEKELKEEKMCSFNRSTIIMLDEKEIEHLKVENERLANRITCQVVLPDDKLEEIKKECLKKVEKIAKGELLKQFAERLKEKAMDLALGNVEFNNCLFATDIDETLKEFINNQEYENNTTNIRLETLKDFREKYKDALKEAVKGENVDCFVESLKIFDKTIEEKICDLK